MRAATQGRIAAAAPRHTPWVLPDTDADLAAVAGASTGQSLMRTLVGRSQGVAERLGGRSDVAWPADGGYTATRETALRRLFRVPALAGQVTSAAVLSTNGSAITPGAAQRSTTGLPLLAYDDALSALLTRTTSASEGVLSTQQFVADSVAVLNELPGTEGRSLFVAAPRSFNPDPDTARAFFAAAGSIPWLTPTTTDAVLARARRVAGTPAAPVTRPAIPATGGRAVLTSARIRQLEQTVRTVRGVAQIRDDGNEFLRTWTRAAEQLASTRWRAAPTAWNTLSGRVSEAAKQTTTAVKVSASTINFLADSGRLQITVTNDLAVPVEDVKLTVEASNPRLRIDSQPPILRIGPKSKATVSVRVTALAAGSVPLRTTLTTPDGTVIGQGADVQVRVTPTGNWIYWGLAAVGGLILLLGIVRTVRRRPGSRRTRTAPAPPRGHPRMTDAPSGERSLARSSALMAAGTVVSRILGMTKSLMLAAVMGFAVTGDAFDVANTLPNSFYLLLAGGVLNAVLVPQITKAAHHDDGGDEFVNRLLTLSLVLMAGATVLATALAPWLVQLNATSRWSSQTLALSTAFAFICLPQIFFYGLYTLLGQVLNARGHFTAYMWAPALTNIVSMVGLGAFLLLGKPREAGVEPGPRR